MSPGKLDSSVDKNTEVRPEYGRTGIEHFREFPLNPISHQSQESDRFHHGMRPISLLMVIAVI